MKQLIVAALLATAVLAERDYEAMFKEYKSTHLKAYANEAEEATRFRNFVANMKQAEVLQAANPLAEFGPNKFSDMSAAEFSTRLNGERHYRAAMSQKYESVSATEEEKLAARGGSIDYRTKGAVTPVKDQGQCGSCWAFSATGNIESQWFLAGNTLTTVSEQELVSCDGVDSACQGGLMDNAFKWLLQNRKGEIVTEASYPYTSGGGSDGTCKSNLDSLPVGAKITSYNHVTKSEDDMAAFMVKQGTLAVAVDASSFSSYRGGIMTNCISRQINHGVLAVGYDDTNVPPYWIIKNSWGTSWGEAGYIRIAKGSNQCLITSYVTTAIVAGANSTKQ